MRKNDQLDKALAIKAALLNNHNWTKQIMKISVSMPYLLEGTYAPTWAGTLDDNIKHLQLLRERNPKQITTFKVGHLRRELPLMHCRYKNLDVYYIDYQDCIQYCVEVEKYKTKGLIKLRTLSQTSVWRNKKFVGIPTMAKWVFDTVLMPINKNILSDSMQSEDGKAF